MAKKCKFKDIKQGKAFSCKSKLYIRIWAAYSKDSGYGVRYATGEIVAFNADNPVTPVKVSVKRV